MWYDPSFLKVQCTYIAVLHAMEGNIFLGDDITGISIFFFSVLSTFSISQLH